MNSALRSFKRFIVSADEEDHDDDCDPDLNEDRSLTDLKLDRI
jgi:hypothetical protein